MAEGIAGVGLGVENIVVVVATAREVRGAIGADAADEVVGIVDTTEEATASVDTTIPGETVIAVDTISDLGAVTANNSHSSRPPLRNSRDMIQYLILPLYFHILFFYSDCNFFPL